VSDWPKKIVVYLHQDKDSNWEYGSKLKLSEKSMQVFKYALMETPVLLSVNKDGTYEVLEWNYKPTKSESADD